MIRGTHPGASFPRAIPTPHAGTPDTSSSTAHPATRALLACGVAAGPIYLVVGALQALIRPGFDIRRHELSLLSNGSLGWIQIANFVATGLLVVAFAVGMRRALAPHPNRGRTWGPLLVGVYGVSLIGAGVFVADPMNGFPLGTPTGSPAQMSGHGLLHFVSGGVGFLALIAACVVFSRRFSAIGQSTWATYSIATGVLFFAAFVGIATGSQQGGATLIVVNLAFTVAVVLGWAWLSALAARLIADLDDGRGNDGIGPRPVAAQR